MAAVRIEEDAFTDSRIELLGEIAGYNRYEALGRIAHLWRVCTARNTYVLAEHFILGALGRNGVEALIGSGLGERTSDGIRVCGTEGRIEWLAQKRRAGSAGGSATAQRKQKGSSAAAKDDECSSSAAAESQHEDSKHAASDQPPTLTLTKEEIDLLVRDADLADQLISRIAANNPGGKVAKLTTAKRSELIQKWAKHVQRMREIDGHTHDEIQAVITWCQGDSFWRSNILSTEKLREQWEKLTAKMQGNGARPARPSAPEFTFGLGGS